MSIESDAMYVLGALVAAQDAAERAGNVDQVSEYVNGPDLAAATSLSPGRVNRAVEFLETQGSRTSNDGWGRVPSASAK